ncbi:hypothetical protein ACFV3E_24480 [Streptomyces sp. NPDC059718]
MAYPQWAAGQTITAGGLNLSDLIGRDVFKATRDTNQSISSNATPQAANVLSWETVELDLLAGWSASSPTRWTCPIAGWWKLAGAVAFNGTATTGNVRGCGWFVNGAMPNGGQARLAASPPNVVSSANARTLSLALAVGDYIELAPSQDTGSALLTATGSPRPYISISFGGSV